MTTETGDYDLVGLGSMVVDAIHRAPRHIGPDEKTLLQSAETGVAVQRLVGGVLLNQVGWARALGLRTALVGKQGDDPDGALLRAGMDRLGIARHLDLGGSFSSFAQVYLDDAGRRAIYMARGATGELTADEVERLHADAITRARVFSTEVSQVPLDAVLRALELAHEAGVRTVVDLDVPLADAVPALGTRDELEAILARADWLKPSLGATDGLVEGGEASDVAVALRARFGNDAVVITAGERGSVAAIDGDVIRLAPPEITVIDSTGAGDAFLGGLLAGLHYGLEWPDALRLGNACGAACCERVGAFPGDVAVCRARALALYAESGGKPIAPHPLPTGGGMEAADAVGQFAQTAAREIGRLADDLNRVALGRAVQRIRSAESSGGRVHVTGVGKSEYVAGYAAALFSSTGTPAFFLHGTEATHGSVGQLQPGDVLVAISNSGQTPELLATVRAARSLEVGLIAICGDRQGTLAREADLVLEARVAEEGGPLGLAPRASVLAQLLVAASLSVALQAERGFTRQDYNLRHPAGALGRKSSD